MPKKIIITGATGSIGKNLAQKLIARGDEITVFSRSPEKAKNILPGAVDYVEWDAYETGDWVNSISGKDAIIHLAGEPLLGSLWSDEYKEKIKKSRIISTRNFAQAIKKAEQKPESFICASAIGYYGPSDTETFKESSPAGNGFLSDVCVGWENAAAEVENYGVRRVSVRVGIVLDKDEGALSKLLDFYNLYLGGIIGNGEQWVSWIHLSDVANIFIHALDNKEIRGVLNGVTPNPVQMKEFMDVLSNITNKPSWLRLPKIAVEALIGDASIPVTEGIKVYPERTLDTKFAFEYLTFKDAMNNLIA